MKIILCFLLITASLLAQGSRSEEDLKAALDKAHKKAEIQSALVDLDMLYQRQKNWNAQAEILRKLLDFWSANAEADSVVIARYSADLGRALERTGDDAGAEQTLKSAISIFAQNGPLYEYAGIEAKRSLAGTLRKENKIQEADQLSASLPPSSASEKPDQLPTVSSKEEPKYTEKARKHYVSGFISLSVLIDETGHTKEIRIIEPLGFGLDENAIKAVQNWRFIPAVRDGEPVSHRAMVEVSFRLLH